MKVIIGLTSIMAFSVTNAQELTWFEAEGSTYFFVTDCIPQSNVLFYSERGGGKLLRRETTNEEGQIKIQSDNKFKPAFALNEKAKSLKGAMGSGRVSYLGLREFAIDAVSVETITSTEISWMAAVGDHAIDFKILKSINGKDYMPLQVVSITKAPDLKRYSVVDVDLDNDQRVFYKIEIYNKLKLRYSTKILATDYSKGVKVYPYSTQDKISLEVEPAHIPARYRILNQAGQMVGNGVLEQVLNTIWVSNLAAGNYFIVIAAGDGNVTRRFIKM